MDRENLEEIVESRQELIERLQSINPRMERIDSDLDRVMANQERIAKAVEGASSEHKEALLFEAEELNREFESVAEEFKRAKEELKSIRAAMSALDERTGPAREALRTAAIETEKMVFEVFKLVATLAIGSVVAISAVTPALFPRLGNLEGLWPAYGWLLVSLASSVVACAYLAISIGMSLNPLRPRRKGWLGRRVPEKVSRLISAIGHAALLSLPLSSLLIGLWKFTAFGGNGLG